MICKLSNEQHLSQCTFGNHNYSFIQFHSSNFFHSFIYFYQSDYTRLLRLLCFQEDFRKKLSFLVTYYALKSKSLIKEEQLLQKFGYNYRFKVICIVSNGQLVRQCTFGNHNVKS